MNLNISITERSRNKEDLQAFTERKEPGPNNLVPIEDIERLRQMRNTNLTNMTHDRLRNKSIELNQSARKRQDVSYLQESNRSPRQQSKMSDQGLQSTLQQTLDGMQSKMNRYHSH